MNRKITVKVQFTFIITQNLEQINNKFVYLANELKILCSLLMTRKLELFPLGRIHIIGFFT